MQSPFGVLSREESIRWLQQLLGTDLAPLFRLLSLPGDIWGVLLAVALATVCSGRRPAIGVAAASAVAAPFRLALAALLAVPRPSGPGIMVFEHQTIASFPSGHTSWRWWPLHDADNPSDCDARIVGLTLVGVVAPALAARIAPGPAHPWLGAVLGVGAVLWIFAAVPRLARRI